VLAFDETEHRRNGRSWQHYLNGKIKDNLASSVPREIGAMVENLATLRSSEEAIVPYFCFEIGEHSLFEGFAV
jgi:hypothetical protein